MSAQEAVVDATAASLRIPPRTAPVTACPICGSEGSELLFVTPDRLHNIPGEFVYRHCRKCGTVFQDPRVIPDDIGMCYPSEYCTHADPANPFIRTSVTSRLQQPIPTIRSRARQAVVAAVQNRDIAGFMGWIGWILARSRKLRERAYYSEVIDEMLPFLPDAGRALDIGCGSGKLLRSLAQVGWDAEGVEWDPTAAEVARRTSACPVRVGDFQEIDIPRETYNLVVLHHVFEHLPDPIRAFRRIADILAPGGRAVIVYPNPESLGARMFRNNWFPWEAPRHLILPPVKPLIRAARSVGLIPIRYRTTARHASGFISFSRAYRRGERVDIAYPPIGRLDIYLGILERILVGLGLQWGEEVIVVLSKKR